MSGIFGFVTMGKKADASRASAIASELFLLSESRGRDSAGLVAFTKEGEVACRQNTAASQLIKNTEYKSWQNHLKGSHDGYFGFLGYTGLSPDKTEKKLQPISANGEVLACDAVITNIAQIMQAHPHLTVGSQEDAEIISALLQQSGEEEPLRTAGGVYAAVKGTCNLLWYSPKKESVVAATNNGSLYYCVSEDGLSVVMASERAFLKNLIKKLGLQSLGFSAEKVRQLPARQAVLIELDRLQLKTADFAGAAAESGEHDGHAHGECCCGKENLDKAPAVDPKYHGLEIDQQPIHELKRCTRCVLPETFPFIEFDEEGVCNYCRAYEKQEYLGREKLDEVAGRLRHADGSVDSVVSFSGGRDSSYGLHYFVKELDLRPIAFTYDWGMVTDLAKRNQARMCADLGVELIVMSADIKKKRENIRKNIEAWLKKPDLGLVPLFMAGDKHYFYYANRCCEQNGLDTILMATNPFEATYFKSGFCGVRPKIFDSELNKKLAIEKLSFGGVGKLSGYYLKQFLQNPAYFNSSLWDTFTAAVSAFGVKHNYLRLYDYIPWDEETVNDVLINEYGWEISSDTETTWRIGDGTAPFYNYIYYCAAGFTENDTLRSNQIREGVLDRETALKLVYRDNMPRFESMKWYFDVVGLDMVDTLKIVKNMPKLY